MSMDYQELVDVLRKKVEIYTICGECNAQITLLMQAAADAIETLMKKEEKDNG